MKVLFVGEGPHDVGSPDFAPGVRAASGVIPILARSVCPQVGTDSVSIFWREVPVLPLKKKKMRGWSAKVRSSIAIAVKNNCVGTVCVADRDREDDRLAAMEDGMREASEGLGLTHPSVCGTAVESIEAWVLGVPTALASVLGLDVAAIQKQYHVGAVEGLHQRSEKAEKRPKDLLEKVANLRGKSATTDFRQDVATAADVAELERHCPQGFKPFADKLRAAFGLRA
jgi:hypothetical protein